MKEQLESMDGQTSLNCQTFRPDRYRDFKGLSKESSIIGRGAGLSYVAASFCEKASCVDMKSFDRILMFDPNKNEIEVEAGTSLGKLYNFLTPRGFQIPIQPGHPQITVGGCVAFNIYGKNQFRDGIFEECVQEILLFHPAYGKLCLSRVSHPEWFDLTLGGMGLTGLILSVKLKLRKLAGSSVWIEHLKVSSLEETADILSRFVNDADQIYSWNDLSIFNRKGAGFVSLGNVNGEIRLSKSLQYKAFSSCGPKPWMIGMLNPLTVPGINSIYRVSSLTLNRKFNTSLFHAQFPIAKKGFYYKAHGRHGFIESQSPEHGSNTTS